METDVRDSKNTSFIGKKSPDVRSVYSSVFNLKSPAVESKRLDNMNVLLDSYLNGSTSNSKIGKNISFGKKELFTEMSFHENK
jgi:hypothetical protein